MTENNRFGTARDTMRHDLAEDDGLRLAYEANIAVTLDQHGLTAPGAAQEAAAAVLALIFLHPAPRPWPANRPASRVVGEYFGSPVHALTVPNAWLEARGRAIGLARMPAEGSIEFGYRLEKRIDELEASVPGLRDLLDRADDLAEVRKLIGVPVGGVAVRHAALVGAVFGSVIAAAVEKLGFNREHINQIHDTEDLRCMLGLDPAFAAVDDPADDVRF